MAVLNSISNKLSTAWQGFNNLGTGNAKDPLQQYYAFQGHAVRAFDKRAAATSCTQTNPANDEGELESSDGFFDSEESFYPSESDWDSQSTFVPSMTAYTPSPSALSSSALSSSAPNSSTRMQLGTQAADGFILPTMLSLPPAIPTSNTSPFVIAGAVAGGAVVVAVAGVVAGVACAYSMLAKHVSHVFTPNIEMQTTSN